MAAKSLVLLVLLVLAAAAFSQAAGQCASGNFQCKDGSQCVRGTYRCDGDSDCGDGSDEEGCDAHTVALPANASVTARVQYAEVHGDIELYLCGGQHCSAVSLRGEGNDGTLRYGTYTGCHRFGGGSGCTLLKLHTGGIKDFPPGEVVLEVRHRPGQLAVWRQGRPDDVLEVPVKADYATLRVRPWNGATDMPVQFTDLRAGRWGLSLVTPAPETVPEKRLSVGDVVTVRVQFEPQYEAISFLLCDDNTCSKIDVDGSASDGSLSFNAFNGCNHQGANWCRKEREAHPPGWRRFSAGVHIFEVQRRPSELAVWLEGRAHKKPAVLVWPGSDRLRVRPRVWSKDMKVEFDGPHCGNAPLSPVAYTVGGEEAAPGFFPWHAAIYLKDSVVKYRYICGGSLVSRKAVISVAHCFVEQQKILPAERFAVGLGKIFKDWDHEELTDVFKSDVKNVILHNLYRGQRRNYADDVAIVQLAEAADISSYIQPICINDELTVTPGEVFRVVGWGGTLERLESVTFKLQSKSSCLDAIKARPSEQSYITTDKFCSVRESESTGVENIPAGLVKGDSGGGAVTKRGDRWFLIGLVSVGLYDRKVYAFTDVSTHNNWRTRITEDLAQESASQTSS